MVSPDIQAIPLDPISVGFSLGAERLGAVAEVAVGPEEYAANIHVQRTCL